MVEVGSLEAGVPNGPMYAASFGSVSLRFMPYLIVCRLHNFAVQLGG